LFTAEEKEAYGILKTTIGSATDIMTVLKALIFAKDNVQQLFDGSTKKLVSSSIVLSKKAFWILHQLN